MSIVDEQSFSVGNFDNLDRKRVVNLGRVVIDAFTNGIRKASTRKESYTNVTEIDLC